MERRLREVVAAQHLEGHAHVLAMRKVRGRDLAAHGDQAVILLAGTEIAGALILCWRRTQWLGACLLLGVFACAQLLSAMQGEWPTRFLQYAASALLIVTMDRTLVQSR